MWLAFPAQAPSFASSQEGQRHARFSFSRTFSGFRGNRHVRDIPSDRLANGD